MPSAPVPSPMYIRPAFLHTGHDLGRIPNQERMVEKGQELMHLYMIRHGQSHVNLPDWDGGNQDGNTVLQGSGTGSGSKGGVYITPGYSYSLTGMYQVAPDRPWGFNVSAALNGREGYAIPYFFTLSGAFATGSASLQATDSNTEFSLDDTNVIDLRIEKELGWSDYNFTVGVELFNALNESTVLQRRHQMLIGQANHVTEILSPRIFRVSLRFRFD